MRLRLLTSFAGDGFNLAQGEETERFTGAEAQRLIAAGYAVPVSERTIERAVSRPPRKEKRQG